jgi:hypothetical protein
MESVCLTNKGWRLWRVLVSADLKVEVGTRRHIPDST